MTDTIPPYPDEDEPEWEPPQQQRQQAPRVGMYVGICAALALVLVLFIIIVVLVAKQRAEAGNPANGLQGNNSPYTLYAFFIGIAGFAVIATIIQHWVINSGGTLNWRTLGISTLVFAIILGVLITIFAKHQSYAGSVTSAPSSSSQPPASSSSLATTVKLKCDPNIGGSFCQAGGNGDNLALDILGVPNIYDLCNSGYSLHFTDNHGENLDDISGTGCFTITGGVDTSMLLGNGSGIPYVAFYPPTSSSTGNTLCGRWVIKLKIKDPSGAVVHAARYSTIVRC